ncbi:MAG: ABC transporter substrate-binding protein [Rhizobiaceae bacterium]|nr:ABC transporter substrate-binding protein [Rhizobiaceae bacterium]
MITQTLARGVNTLVRATAVAAILFGFSFTAGAVAADGGIVAIGGSITEIVYALGEEDQLIARDTTSLFPPEALNLPDVGYIRALSPEGVLSVNPKMMLTLEGAGPPEALDVLQKSGLTIITVPENYNRSGIVEKIRIVGKALGVEEKADLLARQVEADLEAVQKDDVSHTHSKRVLFVLSLQGGKVMAAGTGTSAAGIIEMAGGENAISGVAGYKQISDEAVINAAPDVILLIDRNSNHSTDDDSVLTHAALGSTPAAKAGKVVRMNSLYLLGFGPRTAEAVRELSNAISGKAH